MMFVHIRVYNDVIWLSDIKSPHINTLKTIMSIKFEWYRLLLSTIKKLEIISYSLVETVHIVHH